MSEAAGGRPKRRPDDRSSLASSPGSGVRPPQYLSLEPHLCCPNRRCGKPVLTVNSDLGFFTCERKHCRAHWWATRLAAGDTRSQLRSLFDGNEHFVQVFDSYGGPERIDRPMYWQIWLSVDESPEVADSRHQSSLLERSHGLMRRLVGLLRRPK